MKGDSRSEERTGEIRRRRKKKTTEGRERIINRVGSWGATDKIWPKCWWKLEWVGQGEVARTRTLGGRDFLNTIEYGSFQDSGSKCVQHGKKCQYLNVWHSLMSRSSQVRVCLTSLPADISNILNSTFLIPPQVTATEVRLVSIYILLANISGDLDWLSLEDLTRQHLKVVVIPYSYPKYECFSGYLVALKFLGT